MFETLSHGDAGDSSCKADMEGSQPQSLHRDHWGPAQGLCFWLLNSWISLWANLLESPDLCVHENWGGGGSIIFLHYPQKKTSFLVQLFKILSFIYFTIPFPMSIFSSSQCFPSSDLLILTLAEG